MSSDPVGRRELLVGSAGILALGALGGYELFKHHDSSGEGGGRAENHPAHSEGPGPAISGTFHSTARNTNVGWTISYPPGHRVGDRLPLVLALHGFTGTHVHPIGPTAPVDLLTERHHGHRLPVMAIAAADGGNDYWHVHPGDDPMRMLLEEFLPMCRNRGLGVGKHHKIGLAGESMGGYGSLLIAEEHPALVAAVSVMSPAVWTTYADSQNANPNAFTSQADFDAHNVITHASALTGIPVRIASGDHDPFHPYVEVLQQAMPAGSIVRYPPGVHDNTFFGPQALPCLAFLGNALRRE